MARWVYDGESLKESDPKARSVQSRDAAGVDEGMDGVSTRFAFKVLAATFNHDTTEVGADAVHLMYVLEQSIRREQLPDESREALTSNSLDANSRRATLSSSATIQVEGLSRILCGLRPIICLTVTLIMRTPGSRIRISRILDTGQLLNRELLNQELTKIEKPAGIANPKDFRNEVVKFSLRSRAQQQRQEPELDSPSCSAGVREGD